MEKCRLSLLVITERRDAQRFPRERESDAREESPRPIKPPTGLDLSTNNEQLLTFKFDEELRAAGAWGLVKNKVTLPI